jgi:hypothetical protein
MPDAGDREVETAKSSHLDYPSGLALSCIYPQAKLLLVHRSVAAIVAPEARCHRKG